jgi:2-amino-4-hydroxy-6-hydroxymethyldihydropteridine diphosphokinase
MHRCLISFGANIGDARASVLEAERLLKQLLASGDQVRLSRLYQTPAVGGPSGQAPFINAVAAVHTRLDPWEVWHVIRTIEQQLGRQRVRRWEARRIDLDILMFDQLRIWTPQLKIPHPRMCMRRFILAPAAEVASDWLDPVSQASIGTLAENLERGYGSLILAHSPDLPTTELDAIRQLTSIKELQLDDMLDSHKPNNSASRLVAVCPTKQLLDKLSQPVVLSESSCKLVIFWESVNENSAWEDQHRNLAVQLRLLESQSTQHKLEPLPLIGPRYLLATSDPSWAAHEIAAAFDAMDCHVEPSN